MIDDNSTLDFKLSLDSSDFMTAVSDADRVARGFSRSLTGAFVGVALEGKSLGDVVDGIGMRLSRLALDMAFKPLETGLQNLLSPLTSGLGNLFTPAAPNVTPFAKGGVVASPSFFTSNGALGVAGERGAEAILPLARGSDGSLGVRVAGQGSAQNVTINISTPDVEGFRRSQAEIAASVARLVARGHRSL